MKIKAEKWIVDDSASYKILLIDKCCDKLINSSITSINTAYDRHQCYDYGNDYIYSVKLSQDEYDYDGWNETYYEEIQYCPFCGQEIFVEVISVINKTDEYLELKQERDRLWKQHNKTDSINKAHELKEKVRQLDIQINNMLTSDDFTKEEE